MSEISQETEVNSQVFDALPLLARSVELDIGEVKEISLKPTAGGQWVYRVYFRGTKDYEGGILDAS